MYANIKDNALLLVPNAILCEVWVSTNKDDRQSSIKLKLEQILKIEDYTDDVAKILNEKSHFFCLNVERLWKNCSRNINLFKRKHRTWLEGNLSLPSGIIQLSKEPEHDIQPGTSNIKRGRPKIHFKEASQKTKIRRVESLVLEHSAEELCFAAERSLKLNCAPHQKTKKILNRQETLALVYDLNLSVKKYNVLRSVVNALHKNCFPSYRALLEKKNEYMPSKITVTEISAEVDLQELLQKKVDSILKLPDLNSNFFCNQIKL
ncbi:unnamed protein product [Brassicogethes aeneus]|uniref:Uncharacterized protein n=1 Tax=Brassicogethes aeneus TaxID=1431903 RepID=A0A9P0AUF8_BRAAE|nr:unnamed protein product [Brassicogethes aeneus]